MINTKIDLKTSEYILKIPIKNFTNCFRKIKLKVSYKINFCFQEI